MDRTRLTALTLSVLLLAGCAQASPAPTENGSSQTAGSLSEPERPSGPNVQVDWSKLDGNKTALQPDVDGGRWYPDYTGDLVPSEDYGPLVPYAGALTYSFNTWTDDSGQEQRWYSPWPTPLYGLMTREGKIVTDPVYQSANQADFYWQGQSTTLPVLLLSQAREEWKDFCNGQRYAVAALDGSWCTGFDFWNYTTREDELLLYGPGGVTWIDAVSGAREDWSWEFLGVTEEELPQVMEEIMWVYGLQWTDTGVYLGGGDQTEVETVEDWENAQVRVFRPETTEVAWMSRKEWTAALDEWWEKRQGTEAPWQSEWKGSQLTLSRGGESYTLTAPQPGEGLGVGVSEPFAFLCDVSGEQSKCWLFRLSDGQPLMDCVGISFVPDTAHPDKEPYILVNNKDRSSTLYAPDLEPLYTFSPSAPFECLSCALRDGLLTVRNGQNFFGCYDLDTRAWIFYRNLDLGD